MTQCKFPVHNVATWTGIVTAWCIPFLHFTLSSPSNHFGTMFWSLWSSIRAQGTLLDLHGPPNGPKNGPCETKF